MWPRSSAHQAAQGMRGSLISLYQPLTRKGNSTTALQNRPHHSAREKPGLDPDQSENYRPISNLSFLSKLLERVVFTQIEFYLDASKLLPSHQSAYRKFHSTETLLARVASDLISNASNGKYTLLAMLDLSAAFDTVDHTILLSDSQDHSASAIRHYGGLHHI